VLWPLGGLWLGGLWLGGCWGPEGEGIPDGDGMLLGGIGGLGGDDCWVLAQPDIVSARTTAAAANPEQREGMVMFAS
jgi:hypothetical protein